MGSALGPDWSVKLPIHGAESVRGIGAMFGAAKFYGNTIKFIKVFEYFSYVSITLKMDNKLKCYL